MSQSIMRKEIIARIENSSLKGLIPHDFQIDDAEQITFIPRQPFWSKWRGGWQNWMTSVGCSVYPINHLSPLSQQTRQKKDWRCTLTLAMLDEGTGATLVRLGFWSVKQSTVAKTVEEIQRQLGNLKCRNRDAEFKKELWESGLTESEWICETAEKLHNKY